MSRSWCVAPLLVVGMLGSGFLMGDDKKERAIVIPKLPIYYSKLGLSTKQRNEVLRVRIKYGEQIQELQEKINELKVKEKEDCEKVLTKAQKARLRELLGNSNKTRDVDDKDAPVTVEKKKGTATKDKSAPTEIKK